MGMRSVELLRMSERTTENGQEKPRPKLALLRGSFNLHGIGTTDWRIGLFMSRLGFETHLILVGDAAVARTREIQVTEIRVPIRLPVSEVSGN